MKLPGFSGGFAGVDVFFVISGFLITTLLLNELRDQGSINLPAFFARRARRLLPAFFLVVVTTLILGFFIVVPIAGEYRKLANSAIAASLYFSNLYFAKTGDGYFDDPSQGSPLLHMWSLAVEEQFYFIWPLMILIAIWVATRWRFALMFILVGILVIIFVSSLTYSWLAAESGGRAAQQAFFVLPSRAWELGIGALLALALPYFQRSHSSLGDAMAVLGFAAICATILMFDEATPFPGTAALLPTAGTAAVIAGTWLAPRAVASRVFACAPAVGIGLLSYSWYLWHWPLMTFARELGSTDILRDGAVAIGALGLAWLTYIYVEEPIRRRKIAPRLSNLATIGAGAMVSLVVIQMAFVLNSKSNWSTDPNLAQKLETAANDKGWSRGRCFHWHDNFRGAIPISKCIGLLEPSKELLVIWGDSHADALVGMLETAAQDRFAVLPRPMARCLPLVGLVPRIANAPNMPCARFNDEVLAELYELQREGRLAGVVLAARWSIYEHALSDDNESSVIGGARSRGDSAIRAFEQGFRSTLQKLIAHGIRVLVVAPLPEQSFRVPHCLARHSAQFCSASRALVDEQRDVILRALRQSVEGLPMVHLWDPMPILCETHSCFVERAGMILYRDDKHLTYTASRWLGSYLRTSSAWDAFMANKGQQATTHKTIYRVTQTSP